LVTVTLRREDAVALALDPLEYALQSRESRMLRGGSDIARCLYV
jgi:hypothetical protein